MKGPQPTSPFLHLNGEVLMLGAFSRDKEELTGRHVKQPAFTRLGVSALFVSVTLTLREHQAYSHKPVNGFDTAGFVRQVGSFIKVQDNRRHPFP